MKWSGWRLDWKPQEQWKTVRNVLSENDVDPERVMEVPVLLGNHTTSRVHFTWEGILHEWIEHTTYQCFVYIMFTEFFPSAFGHLFRAMESSPTNMTLNPNWMQNLHDFPSTVPVILCEERAGPMSLSVVSKPLQPSRFVWSFVNGYESGHSEWVSVESCDPSPISIDSKLFHKASVYVCLCQSFEAQCH